MKIIAARDIIAMDLLRKIVLGSKYDLLANNATRDIFNIIKKEYLNNKNLEKSFEYKDANYIIDLVLSHDNLLDKKFDMRANFYPPEENTKLPPYIEIKIILDINFSEKDFERLNYVIYEFIRHEYDHYYKCDNDIYPDKEYYDNLEKLQDMNLSDVQRAQLVQKNVLNPYELDAYAQSIIQLSKKKKIRYQYILRETMDIMFFGFSQERRDIGHKNIEIMSIYNDIMSKLKEKIEQKLQVRKIGMVVGMRV